MIYLCIIKTCVCFARACDMEKKSILISCGYIFLISTFKLCLVYAYILYDFSLYMFIKVMLRKKTYLYFSQYIHINSYLLSLCIFAIYIYIHVSLICVHYTLPKNCMDIIGFLCLKEVLVNT